MDQDRKKREGNRGLFETLKELLRKHSGLSDSSEGSDYSDFSDNSEGSDFSDSSDSSDQSDQSDQSEQSEKEEPVEKEEKKGCPYAVKRAIVESMAEIRRFAEEHKLAAGVVKALLALLAEIVLEALKGKVSGRVLDLLLKALRYEKAREEAFSEGRTEGRNDRIEVEIFPQQDSELPEVGGTFNPGQSRSSIFDIAMDAKRYT